MAISMSPTAVTLTKTWLVANVKNGHLKLLMNILSRPKTTPMEALAITISAAMQTVRSLVHGATRWIQDGDGSTAPVVTTKVVEKTDRVNGLMRTVINSRCRSFAPLHLVVCIETMTRRKMTHHTMTHQRMT